MKRPKRPIRNPDRWRRRRLHGRASRAFHDLASRRQPRDGGVHVPALSAGCAAQPRTVSRARSAPRVAARSEALPKTRAQGCFRVRRAGVSDPGCANFDRHNRGCLAMKDRGQVAFEAYNEPGCHWAFQGAGERARWAGVECAVLNRAHPIEPQATLLSPDAIAPDGVTLSAKREALERYDRDSKAKP